MSANIKTCAKCGAKNFANFTSCFNCGGTEFIQAVPQGATDTKVSAPDFSMPKNGQTDRFGAQNVGGSGNVLSVPVPDFSAQRNSQTVRKSQEKNFAAVSGIETGGKNAESDAYGEENGDVLARREQTAAAAQPHESAARESEHGQNFAASGGERISQQGSFSEQQTPRRSFNAIVTPPVSKLNMQAQSGKPAPSDMISEIADKLAKVEEQLGKSGHTSSGYDPSAVRQSFAEDLSKLDREIESLKSDNRQVMDLLVRTQKEQIEKLEAEVNRNNERLRELSENKGKDREALVYLDEEKRKLQTQLEEERQRFDMLLKDREQTKELSEVSSLLQMDIPSDYVVYSGSVEDPEYIEYAKRQFLKIYPKIKVDNEREDVIYYIPGEFKNPPVLVLNPNVTKNYVRNIRLNLVSGETVAGLGERTERPLAITVEQSGQAIGERHVSAQETAQRAEVASVKGEELRQSWDDGRERGSTLLFSDLHIPVDEEIEESARRSRNNPMDKMVGGIGTGVIDSNSITKIPDISQVERQHMESRSKFRVAACSVLFGFLMLAGIGLLFLPFFKTEAGSVSGVQALASLLSIFDKNYANDFTVLNLAATGKLAALVPYLKYIVLAFCLSTLAAAAFMIFGFKRQGAVKAFKFVFMFLSLLIAVFLTVSIALGYEGVSADYGAWLLSGAYFLIFVAACILLSNRKEKEELSDIKPVTIQTDL